MTPTDRIAEEAQAYVAKTRGQQGRVESYIAGATAEHDRANVLVDLIKDLYNAYGDEWTGYYKEKVESALEQWEGKEVVDETCGMCKEKPMGDGLTVCNECYEQFDGDRRGFWKGDVYQ